MRFNQEFSNIKTRGDFRQWILQFTEKNFFWKPINAQQINIAHTLSVKKRFADLHVEEYMQKNYYHDNLYKYTIPYPKTKTQKQTFEQMSDAPPFKGLYVIFKNKNNLRFESIRIQPKNPFAKEERRFMKLVDKVFDNKKPRFP